MLNLKSLSSRWADKTSKKTNSMNKKNRDRNKRKRKLQTVSFEEAGEIGDNKRFSASATNATLLCLWSHSLLLLFFAFVFVFLYLNLRLLVGTIRQQLRCCKKALRKWRLHTFCCVVVHNNKKESSDVKEMRDCKQRVSSFLSMFFAFITGYNCNTRQDSTFICAIGDILICKRYLVTFLIRYLFSLKNELLKWEKKERKENETSWMDDVCICLYFALYVEPYVCI